MKRNKWEIMGIGFVLIFLVFLLVSKKTNILSDDMRMVLSGVFILLVVFMIISLGGVQ